jgi:hypothetical protein
MARSVGSYEVEPEYEKVVEFCIKHNIDIMLEDPDTVARTAGIPVKDYGEFRARGPAGGGCDILDRWVWSETLEPHELLHEVMHVFLAFPFKPLAEQPDEYVLLMAVERAYAKEMLEQEDYDRCVNWQDDTAVGTLGRPRPLGEIPNYTRKRTWLRALAIGREIGVLSKTNKPTYNAPDWNALEKCNRYYLHHLT